MQNIAAIPRETALRLCQEIRQDNRGKWYTFNGLWCWGCSTFSRGNPDKLCFASKADCRGCGQFNARFDTLPSPEAQVIVEPAPEPAIEEVEETFGPAPIIYLPPAGFSATQRRRTCLGCGRQFRIAANQHETDYCPTCDYRRLRGQLIEQAGEDDE